MDKDIDSIEDTLLGPIGAMDTEFELQVLQYLQTRIELLLKSYATTLEVIIFKHSTKTEVLVLSLRRGSPRSLH